MNNFGTRLIPLALALLTVVPVQGVQANTLPATIDPSGFGSPTWSENWATFDSGEDQSQPVAPAKPHRWRTVLGSGGATSESNRQASGTSLYVDPQFQGVSNGQLGPSPLYLNPFTWVDSKYSYVGINGQKTPSQYQSQLFNMPYMSGLLTTKFSFSQLYGYFEVNARLPEGSGMWPAFWMLPETGTWPQNGELDVFEGLGATNVIYCTVHSADQAQQQAKVTVPFDVAGSSTVWHTYGAAWDPTEIVWYVDRKAVFRTPTPADMKNVPMYLLLDLAVGGSWGGYPNASTVFPSTYYINRVTAWQLPSSYTGSKIARTK